MRGKKSRASVPHGRTGQEGGRLLGLFSASAPHNTAARCPSSRRRVITTLDMTMWKPALGVHRLRLN